MQFLVVAGCEGALKPISLPLSQQWSLHGGKDTPASSKEVSECMAMAKAVDRNLNHFMSQAEVLEKRVVRTARSSARRQARAALISVKSRVQKQWRLQCTLEASVDRRLRAGLGEAQRLAELKVDGVLDNSVNAVTTATLALAMVGMRNVIHGMSARLAVSFSMCLSPCLVRYMTLCDVASIIPCLACAHQPGSLSRATLCDVASIIIMLCLPLLYGRR